MLSMACQGMLGCLKLLVGLLQTLTNGQRIALAQIMEHMEKVWHTQALEPLFCELDQGLGPVTDQVSDASAQRAS
jgi:hypothetical protein